jgi:hypothetical protein
VHVKLALCVIPILKGWDTALWMVTVRTRFIVDENFGNKGGVEAV